MFSLTEPSSRAISDKSVLLSFLQSGFEEQHNVIAQCYQAGLGFTGTGLLFQ